MHIKQLHVLARGHLHIHVATHNVELTLSLVPTHSPTSDKVDRGSPFLTAKNRQNLRYFMSVNIKLVFPLVHVFHINNYYKISL
jgi:hypothetical protein